MHQTFESYYAEYQTNEMFGGWFASPWERYFDDHPGFVHLASKLDGGVVGRLKKLVIAELEASGNKPNQASHAPAINSIINHWVKKMSGAMNGRMQMKSAGMRPQAIGTGERDDIESRLRR